MDFYIIGDDILLGDSIVRHAVGPSNERPPDLGFGLPLHFIVEALHLVRSDTRRKPGHIAGTRRPKHGLDGGLRRGVLGKVVVGDDFPELFAGLFDVNGVDDERGGAGEEQRNDANARSRLEFCPCHNFQCGFDEG